MGADLNETDANGYTDLVVAASVGKTDCVQYLTDLGADVNTKSTSGYSAVGYAASDGHLDCVQALIKAGADVNSADDSGEARSCIPQLEVTRTA
jgi:ankyrin repeat protein